MNGFEDLEVWKKGCRLTIEIYRAFFQCKDYGFKDQVQRSALSVPSNIAEGYERNSPQDFIRFLNIAKGSIGELRTQIYIAKKMSYLEEALSNELLAKSKEISAMLSGLIKSIKSKKGK
jgi:four helix bundle protein